MVLAHALAADRTPTRASQDVDVLGNLVTSSTALRTVVAAVRDLGFEPEPSMDGKRLHGSSEPRTTKSSTSSSRTTAHPSGSRPRYAGDAYATWQLLTQGNLVHR